ncbi:hypothetical protein NPS70_16380 [Streptomyces sp. C10-9-1]|uniref:hypothetical protein n=1 Tax=Streptomyces sp. C10-9-1 TaxID=1859285 RepID=UPI0021111802|nr:hypothetical protein [Streptomyces sp. C10-9-1]MCQ6554763.1 hypothetical protein [Streptomyces sp. C10-9-1]
MAQDARGVQITEGATCIYGAPVGRSIALVEGVIDGFTASGRVWVKVVRRSYGGGWPGSKDRVHVGPDRLVIVDALPESHAQTEAEKVAEQRREVLDRYYQCITDLESGGTVPSYLGTREEALTFFRDRITKLEAA